MPDKKCNNKTRHFRFDMPVNSDSIFCGNVTVEGYGCVNNEINDADIDSVNYEGVEIKPVLELLGGMEQIDIAAAEHLKGLFEYSTLQSA